MQRALGRKKNTQAICECGPGQGVLQLCIRTTTHNIHPPTPLPPRPQTSDVVTFVTFPKRRPPGAQRPSPGPFFHPGPLF